MSSHQDQEAQPRAQQEDTNSYGLLKIFKKFYATLCKILPIEELISEFVACGVITFDEEEEILSHSTSLKKARLLLSNVRKALDAGIPGSFYKLLEIMKLSEKSDCKELAESIIEEIHQDLRIDVTMLETSGE